MPLQAVKVELWEGRVFRQRQAGNVCLFFSLPPEGPSSELHFILFSSQAFITGPAPQASSALQM